MEEKKQNSQKANRILYTVVVAVLCTVAVIIGIVAIANRQDTPPVLPDAGTGTTATPGTSGTKPNGTTPSQPTGGEEKEVYLCPLSGNVARAHDPENFYYSQAMGDWRTHTGIDIAASLGDAVTAAADGVVDEIWEDALMGTCVSVKHGEEVKSIYKNLAPELASGITVGAEVKAGDTLGCVGESALCELADEAHLHFEMTQAGAAVDPLTLLSEESREASLTFNEEVFED